MNPFKYGDPVEGEYYLDRISLNKSALTSSKLSRMTTPA